MYFHDGASKVPTASHDDLGKEQSSRCVSREEVRSSSRVFCTLSVFGCRSWARLVFSGGIVLRDVHLFPFLEVSLLKGFSTSDPERPTPANPFSHRDGAEGSCMDVQTSVERGKSQHKVVETVLDPDVQTL